MDITNLQIEKEYSKLDHSVESSYVTDIKKIQFNRDPTPFSKSVKKRCWPTGIENVLSF